jgi:hypothetical protein
MPGRPVPRRRRLPGPLATLRAIDEEPYQGVTITGALSSGQLGQTDFTASVQRITTLRDGL